MKKAVSFVLAMLMVASLFTVTSAETLDPFTAFVGDDADLYHVTSTSFATVNDDPKGVDGQYMAQHFVPAEETISGAMLRLKYGGGQGTMHLEIREGDANGQAIFQKDVEIVALGNVAAWYTFDFGETVTVTPGQKYALTFWLSSKSTGAVCIAVGSFTCNEGLDLWRHKRFEHSSGDNPYGTLYEEKDLPLKTTGYTVGFEILTPNKMAAMKVDEMISALPQKITVNDEEAIVNCVAAYGALNGDAKALVMKLDDLNAAMDALNTAKEQYAKDLEAATKVEDQISALVSPSDITLAHEQAVLEAKESFDALTATQKELVSQATKEKLSQAVSAVQMVVDSREASRVEALIEALPTPTDVTLDDIQAIAQAGDAFNALTDDQKALVNQDLVEKLTAVIAVVEEWKQYNMGDLNADQAVNAKDALLALKFAVNKATPSYIQFFVADIDANNSINAKDALEMLKFAVGKPSALDQYYAPPIM